MSTSQKLGSLVLVLVLAACGAEPPEEAAPDAPPATEELPAFPEWVDAVRPPSGSGVDALVVRFGEPEGRTAEPTPNRHDASRTDTVVTLDFDGVRAGVYAVTGGDSLVQWVVVGAPGRLGASVIDVGTPWATVVDAFGPPDGSDDGRPFYRLQNGPVEEPVSFEVADDVVQWIRFGYYVD